jgi:cysteinyl-tRNA synthetase
LLDDLSMPRAAAALFSIIKGVEMEFKAQSKDSNYNLDQYGLKTAQDALLRMDKVFGIFYEVPLTNDEQTAMQANANNSNEIPGDVLDLVSQRTKAKEAKDWELADLLRARITELGYAVKDVKGGDPTISKLSER